MTESVSSPPTSQNQADSATIELIERLQQLRNRMAAEELAFADRIEQVVDERQISARNLLHYVSLRQQDLRDLQDDLANRGLSSLGRCEANVEATLSRVIDILCRLSGYQQNAEYAFPELDAQLSRLLLDHSTAQLFGALPSVGGAHIMVTMPTEAAFDRGLVNDLLVQGMSCMRINCAHDDPSLWQGMIENLHWACRESRLPCNIAMDLAGPKLRTGPIDAGRAVLKWRPSRDELGRTLAPARIWLRAEGTTHAAPVPGDATLPVAAPWFEDLRVGDEIRFCDTRGRSRNLRIVEQSVGGYWAEGERTAYVTSELPLELLPSRGKPPGDRGKVGQMPNSDGYIVLQRGDRLLLGIDSMVGTPAQHDGHGKLIRPAKIGCSMPSIFADLKCGERVIFDDGIVTGRVESIHPQYVVLEIVSTATSSVRLRADKGINLPDTELHLASLTSEDIEHLPFIVEHADIVSYSFVRRAEDVERLQSELKRHGRPDMPIVVKIENKQAFEHLPSLLLSAMQSPVSGVMIARGDLAVELGWQRLAEVQEEILWMCEAAHMPVIWATQVLEGLAKTGMPTRAEITDAAMSVRAECVMLNKGPYILDAVRVLGDILRRMQDHQIKKRPMLRRLHLADDLRPTGHAAAEG